MARDWRGYVSRITAFITKYSSDASTKTLALTQTPLVKSVLDSSRHLELQKLFPEKLDKFSLLYDKISGRDVVRRAGVELLQAEQDFVAAQLQRRTLQQALFDVQKKRNDVNKQLDVVSRADDSFLSLITKEHELAREETQLASQHHEADLVERATYEKFTSLLRYLHVEERNYDTRMRQWALVGSLVIGFTSAFVTWLRFRTPKFQDLRDSIEKVRDVYTSQMEIASKLSLLSERLQKYDDFRESVEKLQEVHSCQMEMGSKMATLLGTLQKNPNKAGEEIQPVGPPFPIKTSVLNFEKSGFETKIIYAASACVLFCAIYFLSR